MTVMKFKAANVDGEWRWAWLDEKGVARAQSVGGFAELADCINSIDDVITKGRYSQVRVEQGPAPPVEVVSEATGFDEIVK